MSSRKLTLIFFPLLFTLWEVFAETLRRKFSSWRLLVLQPLIVLPLCLSPMEAFFVTLLVTANIPQLLFICVRVHDQKSDRKIMLWPVGSETLCLKCFCLIQCLQSMDLF